MEYYSDLSTLEARLMKAAGAIFEYRNNRDMQGRAGQRQAEARRLAVVQMERGRS